MLTDEIVTSTRQHVGQRELHATLAVADLPERMTPSCEARQGLQEVGHFPAPGRSIEDRFLETREHLRCGPCALPQRKGSCCADPLHLVLQQGHQGRRRTVPRSREAVAGSSRQGLRLAGEGAEQRKPSSVRTPGQGVGGGHQLHLIMLRPLRFIDLSPLQAARSISEDLKALFHLLVRLAGADLWRQRLGGMCNAQQPGADVGRDRVQLLSKRRITDLFRGQLCWVLIPSPRASASQLPPVPAKICTPDDALGLQLAFRADRRSSTGGCRPRRAFQRGRRGRPEDSRRGLSRSDELELEHEPRRCIFLCSEAGPMEEVVVHEDAGPCRDS
mmetsp:Transcript_11222/g.26487  ORF Transcript_11222/g.26487 Transcript_11222/m.26487 type:complete len:331 (+) Transcript_11222:298-1290(+)